jgi:hypothetical protein
MIGAIVFAAACGEDRDRDAGARDRGVPDAGLEDSGADAGETEDAGAPDGGSAPLCRIDWRPPELPSELAEPFELADVGGMEGWIDISVELPSFGGWLYPPLDSCALDNNQELVLTGAGAGRGTIAQAEVEIRFRGYAGPGLYEQVRVEEDDLSIRIYQSNLGTITSTAGTECAFCVEQNGRAGIFRCIHLARGAALAVVTKAAFICR